ncbi:stage V sporulation protein B [Alkalicoccobacillus murimartini]|uniref:Stage V sporulation protein B n=1 Tax=Alkalicoccobacillus murimartini TaxID=171685 RepID=A0ABT9YC29_9BACI|nr:stage V sporulation protein B [Alkalicoccobacillus murimartini]MDQ0205405.1 stage V sporulation protein B [Alkalicoccobacillus murimartini]
MSKQTFLKGTLILILAGFVTKILGFINRMVMARIMGSEGVGLYMMAVPTMLLILTLTQMGLPVAIAKLVAEAEAKGETSKIKQILIVSLAITISLGAVFTTAMILCAPFVASHLLTDARAYYSLIAVAPIVPIVAVSAVLRGYFQGRQNMKPTAYSQMLEQMVRITLVAVLSTAFLPLGIEYAAAGAMLSVIAGEFVSLIYMLFLFKRKKSFKLRRKFFAFLGEGKDTSKQLLKIALPTTGSRLIGTVSLFFEPIIVAQSLAIAGVATIVATKQYGELAGYIIPLLTLPTFITFSLSTSLLPSISEAAAKNQQHLIHTRLEQAMRLSFIAGGLAMVVLLVYAEQIMSFMYHAPEASGFLKIMAPFCLFLYIQGPLQAALQALDLAKPAMYNSLVGALVKTAAIFALATRPEFGIMGAALAIVIGFVLVTLLHLATIAKNAGFSIELKMIGKLIILIGGSIYISNLFETYTQFATNPLLELLIQLTLTGSTYIVLMFVLNLLKASEISHFPLFRNLVKK